jgi:hypothetical protein
MTSAPLRQAQVDERNIGAMLAEQCDRVGPRLGLREKLDVGFCAQDRLHAHLRHKVVFGDKDAKMGRKGSH